MFFCLKAQQVSRKRANFDPRFQTVMWLQDCHTTSHRTKLCMDSIVGLALFYFILYTSWNLDAILSLFSN